MSIFKFGLPDTLEQSSKKNQDCQGVLGGFDLFVQVSLGYTCIHILHSIHIYIYYILYIILYTNTFTVELLLVPER